MTAALLRRALEDAARMFDDEARRRRHLLFGGFSEIEAEAKLIRDNMDAMVAAVERKPRLPAEYVAEGLAHARGAYVFDAPLEELARDELIAVAIDGWRAYLRTSKQAIADLEFLSRKS